MSDEPSNAASEWLRNVVKVLNDAEAPPNNMRLAVADDFTYEDRRSGPSFPNLDADAFPQFVASIWETGAGRPRTDVREVLAVRDERLAALTYRLDYGNGMVRESIVVVGLDATLGRMHRSIEFDVDDVDGAIAELDRLQRQADAS
jgi:hypothetical protein